MPQSAVLTRSSDTVVRPTVRKIGWPDLSDALAQGFADFSAKPSHMIFLCIIYPVVGLLMARMTARSDLIPLFFPLVAGFALIGPFAAIGLYELSRRRELGLDASWGQVFSLRHAPSLGAIFEVGVLLAVIFVAWLAAAHVIYDATLGPAAPTSVMLFLDDLVATPAGWALIIVGHAAGAVFAALALTVSVVSLPMLVDKPVGLVTALSTSVRCVAANPMTMALWGLIVAAALIVGTLPLFVGLAIVLPVLGHATWHLYRKLVEA
ncbi:DUF2189 domain-containing protein [Beijerinckia sp. L45]|uniref:DUF2189 domain-containing protein n=1 Tax=Beijerinckia sp. L45 TaxID=1641855 RepID=UPI00131EB655|nr:DUF2189 domain-containing protein [Beijerinckia sp. L45]